ncbi:hypothetical protein K1I42_10670, partial [Hydrogenophilus thermoluteolus]
GQIRVHHPRKDGRHDNESVCPAKISCRTAHRKGFDFGDHGFRKLAEWKRTLFKNYGIRIDEAAIAQAYRNVGSALPKTGGPVIDKKAGKSEGQ